MNRTPETRVGVGDGEEEDEHVTFQRVWRSTCYQFTLLVSRNVCYVQTRLLFSVTKTLTARRVSPVGISGNVTQNPNTNVPLVCPTVEGGGARRPRHPEFPLTLGRKACSRVHYRLDDHVLGEIHRGSDYRNHWDLNPLRTNFRVEKTKDRHTKAGWKSRRVSGSKEYTFYPFLGVDGDPTDTLNLLCDTRFRSRVPISVKL